MRWSNEIDVILLFLLQWAVLLAGCLVYGGLCVRLVMAKRIFRGGVLRMSEFFLWQ